jgi:spore coat protein CotF
MEAPKQGEPLLGDQDRAQDMLLMEKNLSTAYFTAERECANQPLRQAMHQLHEAVEGLHARLFHAMHERSWIKTPVAGQQAIEGEIIKWEQRQVRQPELGN